MNMNITGELFDYGSRRWTPTYKGDLTAAYFDQTGLYSYGRQPACRGLNLQALASALRRCVKIPRLSVALATFSEQLQQRCVSLSSAGAWA